MIASLRHSLAGRLSLAMVGLFILFGSLAAWLLIHASRNYEQEVTQRIHHDLAQHVVDHYLLYRDGKPDYEAAKTTFHDLMILGANFEFYLVNKHGNIVAFDAKPEEVQLQDIRLAPVNAFLQASDEAGVILGDDPKNPGRQKVFSVAPIYQMGEVYGYLYVVVGSQARDALESRLWSSKMLYSSMGILILVVCLSLLALLVVLRWFTRPLQQLTQQVQAVRDAGFDSSPEIQTPQLEALRQWQGDSHNDIHILGYTFAQALQTLQQQYEHVVSIDDLRKELLSHVSHDLRTPLASLLGYLETWEIQQSDLSPEKSSEYISTARRSAQKIAMLIEQLFELAHLDGNNVQVQLERFSIAELVQDVLQKFSMAAEQKHIQLQVRPQDSSILVRADIEKMERVFTNLVENALRHTPDGGSITVRIEASSGFVSIEVSDTGIGIPEQDIPYIFDAHFKAGNSVRENTAHGGLGLAITKKLLELHASAISVHSQMHRGTTFRFALPAA